MSIKQVLRQIRNSPPINRVVVPLARAVFGAVGLKPLGVVRRFVRVGEVRSRLPNGRTMILWSAGDDEVPTLVYWFGWDAFETETARVYWRLAQKSQTIFDIGAHAGYFTVLGALTNPETQVFAFDPLPANRERVALHVKLNGLTNAEFVTAALGDFEGEADFFEPRVEEGGLPGGGSLAAGHFQGNADLICHRITVMTGDAFVEQRQIPRVDLIKMDTESTEPAVLRGLETVIARHRPHIICEVLCRPDVASQLDLFVAQHGYKAYHLRPEGPVLVERIQGHPEWRNYLFSPLDPQSLTELLG